VLRLAQIELLGFKSFPHKTVIDLEAGVNCVVGPNGSGKSNIADAILFAFGCQSSRELRTGRFSGLIFAGTDQLRPLNLASVTLHFVRTENDGPPSDDLLMGLSRFDEELELPDVAAASLPAGSQLLRNGAPAGADVAAGPETPEAAEGGYPAPLVRQLMEMRPGDTLSLTRRVFRDGTGGYYLGDEPVRLKDVDALFNHFHLGRTSAFAISQGEVEKKILETPQELREWLAEATGVALLLQQKSRAQARLKRTQANLERLDDIRHETRTLVAGLADQRVSAERHLALAAQLRAVELFEIRREVEAAQRQQEAAARALGELGERVAAAQGEAEELGRRQAMTAQAQVETERAIEEAEEEQAALREQAARAEREEAVARQALAAASQAIIRAVEDQADLEHQLAQVQSTLEANDSECGRARDELAAAVEVEERLKGELAEAQAQAEGIAVEQAGLASAGFDLAQEEVRLSNELNALARHEQHLLSQAVARERYLAAAQEQLASLQGDMQAEEERSAAAQREADGLRAAVAGHASALAALADEAGQAADGIEALRRRQAELAARRTALVELGSAGGSLAEGRRLLRESAELGGALHSLEDIAFPPELRPAFTRLLAHLADALIAPADARGMAHARLREAGSEALLLTAAEAPELPVGQASVPGSQSQAGTPALRIWRRITAAPETVAALHGVLGDVALAESVAEAEALLDAEPALSGVVLADGTALICRGYAYLGVPSAEAALHVARGSDLAQVDTETSAVEQQLALDQARLDALRSQQAEVQRARDETAAKLAAEEERGRSAAALAGRIRQDVADREAEAELLERHHAELVAERHKAEAEQRALAERLEQARQEHAALAARLEEHDRARREAEALLDERRRALGAASTAHELARQRLRHVEQAGLDLAERVSNLRHRAGQVEARLEALQAEQEQMAGAAERAQAEAAEAGCALEAVALRSVALRERRGELSRQAAGLQVQATQAAAAISRLEQDSVALGGQRERAVERVAQWLSELRERFNMTLSELIGDPALAQPPPGLDFDVSEAGRGKLRDERARLSAELTELGAVNLLAIEQHEQYSARLSFLDGQAEELSRAVGDLERLVVDLDRTTERQYRESLRRIEARFNEIYLRLFGGGWARLRFEAPEQLIESGVEAEVMLPAGRRHSLRSLSGGQRSLIFLALFFAVHSVRSPGFCILDEVDAALDDANVELFTRLLRDFALGEQFVVITHNKSTMETADRLIGVVSRPKGVSNLLSVNLKEARRLVDRGAA